MDDISHITDMDSMGAGIPDPEGTDVNQYFLSYKIGKSQAKYGRNRIILDNQRFVGGVGFRQNEQTYDSFTFLSKDIENLTVFAAGITGVKRIFGEDATADKGIPKGAFGVHDHRTALLNVNYKFNNAVSLTGYYYGIDNKTFSRYSTDTFGVRATGKAAGFSYEDLKEIQKIIDAEKSDIFDVLEFVAFAKKPMTRVERIITSEKIMKHEFSESQMQFISFVLEEYENEGITVLDDEKLPILLELKYQSIENAKSILGDLATARNIFLDNKKDRD